MRNLLVSVGVLLTLALSTTNISSSQGRRDWEMNATVIEACICPILPVQFR